ncbi:DUF1643 domain-containing protein [Mycobacteroides abscessus]|uniref:DUF1643 domain-containing protein n=1 Tax=Mycobacteroides abscessus TaxID=36809 RepID=UPI001A9884C6|nr:DUF1643 domain-containing protein [Mycobacteroides abscessus]
MVRMHLAHWRDGECEVVTWAVCDGHKNLIEAAAKYFRGVTCTACDTTLDAVFKVLFELEACASTAVLSACGTYRYELTRSWGVGAALEFVMLNPSTADAAVDDPTIRRCVGFAKRWGYASIVVHNLYAYRATDPTELANAEDPIGPENRKYLSREDAACTIAAWGAHPAATGWWSGYPYGWQRDVIKRSRLYCLGVNANGSPKHPLYVKGSIEPIEYNPTGVPL